MGRGTAAWAAGLAALLAERMGVVVMSKFKFAPYRSFANWLTDAQPLQTVEFVLCGQVVVCGHAFVMYVQAHRAGAGAAPDISTSLPVSPFRQPTFQLAPAALSFAPKTLPSVFGASLRCNAKDGTRRRHST